MFSISFYGCLLWGLRKLLNNEDISSLSHSTILCHPCCYQTVSLLQNQKHCVLYSIHSMLFCLIIFYSVIFWEENFGVPGGLIFSLTYVGWQEGFSIGSVLSRNINYFSIPHTGQKLCKNNSIASSLRTAPACQNYENPTEVTRLISKTTLVLLFITSLALSQNDRMKSILPTTATSVGEYWSHSDSDFCVQQSGFFLKTYPTFPPNQLCLDMTSYMLSPQSLWRFLEHIPSCKGPYSVCMIFFLRLRYERRREPKC